MWAMVLCGLSYGGKVLVYDGSPFQPDPFVTLRLVEKLKYVAASTPSQARPQLHTA
jgi:acetoacetyl-CoA synthetase